MSARMLVLLSALVLSAVARPEAAKTGGTGALPKAELPEWPRTSTERVVLRTTLGDLVLALYPDAAPRHAKVILGLVRLGIYDSTHFHLVDRNFAAQVSGAGRRRLPITPLQASVLNPLKAEITRYTHHYGTVSMAHDPDKPDSAVSSFLILFNDVPQMDGKFTVVGEVSRGYDVLEALRNVPTDQFGQPLRRIEIKKAFVVENEQALEKAGLQPVIERAVTEAEVLPVSALPLGRLLLVAGLILFAVSVLFPGSMLAPSLRATGLLTLLFGYFALLIWFGPEAAQRPVVSLALFFGGLAIFKLMTAFELPPHAQ